MNKQEVEERYLQLCKTKSDINEHLPRLHMFADNCKHITEFGVRGCVSLFAFLSSNAEKVVAVDILNVAVPDVDKLEFICADDLQIEIESTDFLFIDTAHNYKQLKQELKLHAGKVKKYIGFHDTAIFGTNGDDGGIGLMPAISEFLAENKEWHVVYQVTFNNGLTILAKR